MTKVRQDAWSHEDDLLLAETVLRHVREGSTQLKAFEEVGDELNRTSAACGFRWNAEVRKRYHQAMELAKRQRKERKRALAKDKRQSRAKETPNRVTTTKESISHSNLTLDHVIDFLQKSKDDFYITKKSKRATEKIEQENETLKETVEQLEKQLSRTEVQLKTIREDYEAFIQIMDRARQMTVLENQGTLKAPAFRMDKNGNLEPVTKQVN